MSTKRDGLELMIADTKNHLANARNTVRDLKNLLRDTETELSKLTKQHGCTWKKEVSTCGGFYGHPFDADINIEDGEEVTHCKEMRYYTAACNPGMEAVADLYVESFKYCPYCRKEVELEDDGPTMEDL